MHHTTSKQAVNTILYIHCTKTNIESGQAPDSKSKCCMCSDDCRMGSDALHQKLVPRSAMQHILCFKIAAEGVASDGLKLHGYTEFFLPTAALVQAACGDSSSRHIVHNMLRENSLHFSSLIQTIHADGKAGLLISRSSAHQKVKVLCIKLLI